LRDNGQGRHAITLFTRGKFPNFNTLFEAAKKFPDAAHGPYLRDIVTYDRDRIIENLFDHAT
jgi:hypothetical protein